MTATETRVLPCHILQKFASEERPPTTLRRDERIRSMASSFEEITESEEEEIQEIPSVSSWNGRSPYALQHESPFAQRRSNSLSSNHPLISPKFTKRMIPPRLTRGFSDPVMRRKSSLPTVISRLSPERSTEDLLTLPPIPEAATPASPVTSGPSSIFKETPTPRKESSPQP